MTQNEMDTAPAMDADTTETKAKTTRTRKTAKAAETAEKPATKAKAAKAGTKTAEKTAAKSTSRKKTSSAKASSKPAEGSLTDLIEDGGTTAEESAARPEAEAPANEVPAKKTRRTSSAKTTAAKAAGSRKTARTSKAANAATETSEEAAPEQASVESASSEEAATELAASEAAPRARSRASSAKKTTSTRSRAAKATEAAPEGASEAARETAPEAALEEAAGMTAGEEAGSARKTTRKTAAPRTTAAKSGRGTKTKAAVEAATAEPSQEVPAKAEKESVDEPASEPPAAETPVVASQDKSGISEAIGTTESASTTETGTTEAETAETGTAEAESTQTTLPANKGSHSRNWASWSGWADEPEDGQDAAVNQGQDRKLPDEAASHGEQETSAGDQQSARGRGAGTGPENSRQEAASDGEEPAEGGARPGQDAGRANARRDNRRPDRESRVVPVELGALDPAESEHEARREADGRHEQVQGTQGDQAIQEEGPADEGVQEEGMGEGAGEGSEDGEGTSSKRRRRGRRGGRGHRRANAQNGQAGGEREEGEGEPETRPETAPEEAADKGQAKAAPDQKGRNAKRRMYISVLPGEQVEVAITNNGIVDEYYLDMLHQKKIKGNIYRGVIVNIDVNLQAAFVDFGTEKNGFLQIDEIHPEYYTSPQEFVRGKKYPPIQNVLRLGQEVLVQVVKEPNGSKGAFLTTWISLAGRFLVLTPGQEQIGISRKVDSESERHRLRELMNGIDPGDDLGVIVRTVSAGVTQTTLKNDLAYLKRTWNEVRRHATGVTAPACVYKEPGLPERAVRDYLTDDVCEIWVDNADIAERIRNTVSMLFPQKKDLVRVHNDARHSLWERFNLRRQLDQIYSREVLMPSGGRLVFDQTEALMAIDINSGKISCKGNFESMAFKTNMEAAETIARQLKLRDIGGQVVIDFIEMREHKHVLEVEKTLRNCMRNDRARHDILRMSSFGLLELVRQRTGTSAISISMEPCPACGGTGLRRNLEWQSLQALRDISRLLRSRAVSPCRYEMPQELGLYLLNHKRDSLKELENQYGKAIEIVIRP